MLNISCSILAYLMNYCLTFRAPFLHIWQACQNDDLTYLKVCMDILLLANNASATMASSSVSSPVGEEDEHDRVVGHQCKTCSPFVFHWWYRRAIIWLFQQCWPSTEAFPLTGCKTNKAIGWWLHQFVFLKQCQAKTTPYCAQSQWQRRSPKRSHHSWKRNLRSVRASLAHVYLLLHFALS